MTTFKSRVFEVVKQIPKGQTMTYKQVAVAAGSPNAFRAVGTVLKSNYDPSIPCHRVIRSNGELGNYNRGNEEKRCLLKKEGAVL
ncbi:MAG: MGMT family protein [Patescibacteria group bacterium]